MKIRHVIVLIMTLFILQISPAAVFAEDDDDNTPKPIKLGLDVAKAMAEQKSVGEGLKAVAQDKWSEWLWDSIGGYEKFIFQNNEAEIPKAKEKIKKFVEKLQAMEAATLAIIEGRYDDALITAVDQAADLLDHPLVSVTWQMAKLTYQSHKEVIASQAALEIETLYGMMSNDRRLMGVMDPKSDAPPMIPETAQSADYFFDKYVMTNDAARQMLKSYVEKVLGDQWPEQSWSEYAASWMAVGSGVDTKRSVEIEALATEWKNKGRSWISALIRDVNKQAKVAWGQTRVRQMMAEFQQFSARVGRFYNEDMEQAFSEFLSIREYTKKLPEMRQMPGQSQAVLAECQKRFSRVTTATIGDAGALLQAADDWQLNLLQASGRASVLREDALAKQLSNARNAWLGFKIQVNNFITRNAQQVVTATEHVFNAQSSGGPQTPEAQQALSIAGSYYSAYKPYLQPFDWALVKTNMSNAAKGGEIPPAEPEALAAFCLDLIDKGQIGKASGFLRFWSEAFLGEWSLYRQTLDAKVFNAPPPADYVSDQLALKALHESILAQWVSTNATEEQQKNNERLGKSYEQPRKRMDIKEDAYKSALTKAGTVANNLLVAPPALHASAVKTVEEAVAAYGGLAGARAQQYKLYMDAMAEAERDLPVTAARNPQSLNELLPLADVCHVISSINVDLKRLKDNVHTVFAPLGPNDGDMLPSLPSIILTKAGDILGGIYPSPAVSQVAVEADRIRRVWMNAAQRWQEIPDLSQNDITQIQAFVDGKFDPRARMAVIDSVASATPAICDAMMASARELLQFSATDGENRERDADWLKQKSREVQAFFDAQVRKGHFESAPDGYRIAAPSQLVDGMVMTADPFPHAMTAGELSALAANAAAEWTKYPGYQFMTKYAPLYAKRLNAMLAMSHVTPAREANFVSPLSGHLIYLSDMEKALGLLGSIASPFSDYESQMAKVVDLVPGILRAASKRDLAALEQRAKNYGMSSAEEYVMKTTGKALPAPDYSVNDNVREALNDPRLQHDLGRKYIAVAKLAIEKNEARMAYLNQQAQGRAKEATEEDKKKAAEELAKQQEAYARRQGYSLGDARLNALTSTSLRGDVLLTKDDLKNGQIELTGTFNQTVGMAVVQISLDGGKTWTKANATKNFKYAFVPTPGVGYSPRLRVITDTDEKYDLNPFSGLTSLVYQNVAYQQAVAEAIQKLADAYERQDVSAFGDGIAEGYLGGKGTLVEGARFDFGIFQGTRIAVGINRIEKQRTQFIASIRWDRTQTVRSSGKEHKTSGRTTMIFTFENDRMKVYNLRGDLLFAVLLPEIAQASGLRMDIVDGIALARDSRDPFAVKTEETEDQEEEPAEKKEESATPPPPAQAVLSVKTGSITSYDSHNYFFDFSDGTSLGECPFPNDMQFRSTELRLMPIMNAKMKTVSNFDTLSEAPDSSTYDCLWDGVGCPVSVGKAFVFITDDGYYGKMQITGISGSDPKTITFKYAIQLDRTWNIPTQ